MKTVMIISILVVPLIVMGPSSALALGGPDDVVVIDTKPENSGWLGVSIQDMTPRLAKSMEVETKQGALVNDVVEGSPAADAGIKDEDIIVEFNGESVEDEDDLAAKERNLEPDTSANRVVVSGNDRKFLDVTVGETQRKRVHAFTTPIPPMAPEVHMFMNHSSLGMDVQDLSEQLAEYFGAPKNEGVLVASVEKDGPAGKAGLKAGDIILKVENQTIREEDDIRDEVEEYKKGDKVQVDILRDKSSKTFTDEIQEDQEGFWFRGPHSDMEFEFDHESLDDFEHELQLEIERSQPEMDELRIRLKEIGKQIKEWGKELKEQLRSLNWS